LQKVKSLFSEREEEELFSEREEEELFIYQHDYDSNKSWPITHMSNILPVRYTYTTMIHCTQSQTCAYCPLPVDMSLFCLFDDNTCYY